MDGIQASSIEAQFAENEAPTDSTRSLLPVQWRWGAWVA